MRDICSQRQELSSHAAAERVDGIAVRTDSSPFVCVKMTTAVDAHLNHNSFDVVKVNFI